MDKHDIFISYRQVGGFEFAEILYTVLTQKGYRVFLDKESLLSGRYDNALTKTIASCTDIIILLPPNALERCKNDDDWVRREYVEAERQGKNIIPIYMHGFTMPDELPEEMETLHQYQAISTSSKSTSEIFNELVTFLHSQANTPTNYQFRLHASSIKNNIIAWRIPFFPILTFLIFELFMIIPFEPLRVSKLYMDESNFALCRMVYLCISSLLIGTVLLFISRIKANLFLRTIFRLLSIITICFLSMQLVTRIVWTGAYPLLNTPLFVLLLITPLIMTGCLSLTTFCAQLIFVYLFEVE